MDDDDGGNTLNPSQQPPEPAAAKPDTPVGDSTGALECRLIARLAARDSSAMVEFYQALANPLYSYALRTLGNEGDAEEVLQDTLVRV